MGFDHVNINMVLLICFFIKQARCYHVQVLIGQKPMVYGGGKLVITQLSIMLRYVNFKEKTNPDCCIRTHIFL